MENGKDPFLIHNLSDAMYHILVIDDEETLLNAIKIGLSRAGFKVEIASDGQEGIQKFNSGRFDLVITDIRMPGVDGRDVVNHIHNSDNYSTPIIGISASPWLFKNIQFDAVLPKPFYFKDLINSIRHISMQDRYNR
ncbi:MAG TPA: response regulator [Desulfobacterales bacterium]|nr:response regulator [Desulfobacterales bacterium]